MSALHDWARVKRVLEGALALAGGDRAAYLTESCGTDAALREQVDTLLSADDRLGTFLETPAVLLLDESRSHEELSGRAVGSYRLLARLGAGGSGEVYLAHDAKLDRPVALKVLSPGLADDDDRLRRFRQEARAASSLNHPNIVVVHDFGELDGRPYIVTEFVEGETLRQRLGLGPLPVREAVDIGLQVAGALAAAHDRGIVHRDIKPHNLMLRPDGYVKVLDFGLAKLAAGAPPGPHDEATQTQRGMIRGTPQYMSPEQARGLDIGVRSDVWSLGVVLYEAVAGRSPFAAATAADAIAAILGDDPPPLELQAPQVPDGLCAIVAKAMRRDPLDRYADAGGILEDLRALAPTLTRSAPQTPEWPGDARDDSMLSRVGERRRATVLVSLICDYTSLVERLAPPEVDAVIGNVRAAAIDTMRRHGGLVNQSIGDAIVSVFGIPVAHEDDDLRAVRAAFDLHALTRELGRTVADAAGVRLRLQSGLHAGSVVAQRLREGPRRYALTGRPAEAAARLAAAAEPDAIWVSPECQRQIAPFARTEPRAPVSVDAAAPPITPHSVLGESGLESRFDAPDRGDLTPYAGRAEELAALLAKVELAQRGEGQVVLVTGEAGSGKSRLLHELRARVAASEVRVLQGRCRSYGGMTSYLPFVEALQGALGLKEPTGGRPDAARVVEYFRAIESSLEPFIPLYLHLLSMPSDEFPVPRHLRGEHLQAAMLEALAAFFTSYSHRSPGVLLLEDWHWADGASRDALRQLAAVVAACPLLVVVTARPEPGAAPDGSDSLHRLHLAPLEFAASLSIAKAVLAVEHVPEEFAKRLHERTSGNPFFLEEMCHALREARVVTSEGSAAVLNESAHAIQLPDSVQSVIRSRLDRLSPDCRDVVRVASVIGREFSRQVLRESMGAADLGAALDRLKAAGIVQQIRVVPDPVYRFKHVLTQEVAYESLLEHQRKSLHQAVGRAIARWHGGSFDEPLERLAHHFGCAEAWDDAIVYGHRAAARATELSQFADALGLLERVRSWLTKLPDEPSRTERIADVLLRQERVCETLGLRGRQLQLSAELIALLAPLGASERLAEAYLRQGDVSTLLKRFDAADRALATALRMSRERRDSALERSALRSIGLLRWHQGRHAEALAITENALAIDRQRQDDPAVAGDLSNLASILRSLGENERALVTIEEALAMPVVAGDPIKRSYLLHILANVHRMLGDTGRALSCLQDADESSRAHMLPIQRSFHLTSMAHIHLQEGRLSESLRLYHEAVELSRRARHADGLAQSLRMLSEIFVGLGRHEDALPHLQEAAKLFAQLEQREAEAAMRHHLAVALEQSAQPAAIDAWERVRALAHEAGDASGELAALEGIARATRALGRAEDAIRRFEDALALATRLGQHPRGAALRNTLGILEWERGAYIEALTHFEAALGLVRALADRVHEGLMLNSIGVTLERLQRYEEARTALEDALAVNRQSGERILEAHTLAALGDIAQQTAQYDAALSAFDASLAIRRERSDRRGEGWMLHHLGVTRALMGDAPGAQELLSAAEMIADETGDAALGRACRAHTTVSAADQAQGR